MGGLPHALALALLRPDAEHGLEEELATSARCCALMAADCLLPANRVVTYSASSVCEEALRYWAALRGGGEVVVAESRPGLEGVALAKRLATKGLEVCLITDAQLGLALREADAILVGADAIDDDDRLLNKVGTATAVTLAREAGVPAYAACQTHKIAPPGWPLALERQEPGDVCETGDFRVQNIAFDATPLAQFTQVLTEYGTLTRKLLRKVGRELAPSPLLGCTPRKRGTPSDD
jgi:translation initiation factor 2B subunit (eIF-2B alpha/beta/delta family)